MLQLLSDLKGANEETTRQSQLFFAQYEKAILDDINSFSSILNQNGATTDDAQSDLEAIDDKIVQTKDYLDWNEKRRASNNVKVEKLAE